MIEVVVHDNGRVFSIWDMMGEEKGVAIFLLNLRKGVKLVDSQINLLSRDESNGAPVLLKLKVAFWHFGQEMMGTTKHWQLRGCKHVSI